MDIPDFQFKDAKRVIGQNLLKRKLALRGARFSEFLTMMQEPGSQLLISVSLVVGGLLGVLTVGGLLALGLHAGVAVGTGVSVGSMAVTMSAIGFAARATEKAPLFALTPSMEIQALMMPIAGTKKRLDNRAPWNAYHSALHILTAA